MTKTPKHHKHSYILTAGESDAEGRMPLTLVTERIIEVATEHANALGIGYATLIKENIGWVLSRVSIEMLRYPAINEHYSLTTWIESYNRRFSERNFMLSDADGNVIGYARTVWVAMDFASRTVADLSRFGSELFVTDELPCPIDKAPRIPSLPEDCEREQYTFRYCDLDFNRHVNTVRYLDVILNHWSLEHHDTHAVKRLDIMFHHECHYGESAELRVANTNSCPASGGNDCCGRGDVSICELALPNGTKAVTARLLWHPRKN